MIRPPSHADPNSLAAARSIAATAPAQRRRVLEIVYAFEPISAEAIQDALGLAGNSVRPRLVELERDGYVHKDGTTTTRAGRRCYLYRPTMKGLSAVVKQAAFWDETEGR